MSVATLEKIEGSRSSMADFDNLAEWLHSLGDISPERVVLNPLIGTATEADLLRLVETKERLVELIDRTLVEKVVGTNESRIAGLLIYFLNAFIIPRKLGSVIPADGIFRMVNGRIRLPDVSFIESAQTKGMTKLPPITELPIALAVEVFSKGNTIGEMHQKLKEYFASGTRLFWLIDPENETVAVFDAVTEIPTKVLTLTDTLDGGDVLPGFILPLDQLFTAPI